MLITNLGPRFELSHRPILSLRHEMGRITLKNHEELEKKTE